MPSRQNISFCSCTPFSISFYLEGMAMSANQMAPFIGSLCQRCNGGGGISIGGCKRSLNVRKREAAFEDVAGNFVDNYDDINANYF